MPILLRKNDYSVENNLSKKYGMYNIVVKFRLYDKKNVHFYYFPLFFLCFCNIQTVVLLSALPIVSASSL